MGLLRILIADDHEVVRRGLRSLLSSRPDWQVCGEAVDGRDAVEKAKGLNPDVIMLDISMPNLNGLDAARIIRKQNPKSEILILSQHESAEVVRAAMDAGARGYIKKGDISRDLVSAIEAVSQHKAVLSSDAVNNSDEHSEQSSALPSFPARVQEESPQQRDRLLELFMEAPTAIGMTSGPDHCWTFVNRALLELTGGTRGEDFIGKTVRETLPESLSQAWLKSMDRVYRTGVPFVDMEMKASPRRADGHQFRDAYLNCVHHPICNSAGEVEGILLYAVETTHQVLARQHIAQSEERLRLAQAAAQIGTWEWDPVTNISSLSPELRQIFGIESTDPEYMAKWAARVFPEDMPKVKAEMEGSAESGNMDFEYRYRHPQLGLRWLYCKGRRFSSEPNDTRMYGVVLDVTQRKQAEEAGARLAAIIESSDDAIVSKNLDGVITSWNAGAQRIFGYTETEAVGQPITLIIPPELREEETDILRRIRAGERIQHFETVRVAKNGQTVNVSLTISPVKDSTGRVIGASKIARDITERKRAEAELRKVHEELDLRVQERTAELARATRELREQAQLLELAHDAIVVRDLEGRVSFWNHGAERLYGWTSEEALGRVTHTLFATEWPEPFVNIQRQLLHSGSWEGELTHTRKDGSRIIVESRWVLQYDAQHQPIRVLEINRDVTRRRRAEEHIAGQAQMLDLANDAIFVRGLDGKISYWNRGAERLYGWKKHEVVGTPVENILHTEFPLPLEEITKHLQTYGTWEGELKHARRDCTWITVSSRWTLWTNEGGEPLGFLEINTDVTERKLAEQNLRTLSARLLQLQDEERRRIARELHDSAGQLLVALDLNLASIGTDSRNLGPESTRSIAESKQLVQELSRELRTISHLLHPPLLDEAGLPSAVRWYVDGYAKRSKIPVKLELAPDLGRLPRDLETTLFRIVQECLTNVHRHSGSPTAEIRILRRGDQVTVEVRDQGKGMSSGTRGGSPKPMTPGVGIQGMHERVRQLGGRLDIQSVNGHGTLVRATLPVGKAQDGEDTLGAAS